MDTRGQYGDSGCNAADTHMDTRSGNWQNIKHRHIDRPAKHLRGTLQNCAVRSTISSNTMRDGMCQDSSVGMATTVQAGRSGDRISVGGGNFRAHPDRCRSRHSFLYNGYRGFPGFNRPWRGVHCSPLPSPRLRKMYCFTFNPPLVLRRLFYSDFYLYLYHELWNKLQVPHVNSMKPRRSTLYNEKVK